LDVHVFGNGLHDEVRIRKVLTGGREGQAGIDRRTFLLADLSPADRSGKGPVHVATSAVACVLVDLDTDDVEARAGEHLGDTRAHRAEPDDSDLVKFLHHGFHFRGQSMRARVHECRKKLAFFRGSRSASVFTCSPPGVGQRSLSARIDFLLRQENERPNEHPCPCGAPDGKAVDESSCPTRVVEPVTCVTCALSSRGAVSTTSAGSPLICPWLPGSFSSRPTGVCPSMPTIGPSNR